MSTFKVGDRVVAVANNSSIYRKGERGIIIRRANSGDSAQIKWADSRMLWWTNNYNFKVHPDIIGNTEFQTKGACL